MHVQQNAACTPEVVSRVGLALMAFTGIGAVFVMTEHTPHLFALVAYALLLALPFIHMFTRANKETTADGADPAPARPKKRVPILVQLLIWTGLIGLLAFVGVGLGRTQQGTVQPGSVIPDFELNLFSGYEYNGAPQIRLSDLRGKVVAVNFWASWCKPCEQEAAALQGAWEYYEAGGHVVFLGVDYVDTEPAARVFMKKFGATYPNGPDIGTRISQLFRIKGVPETFILDPEGVLRYVKIGPFVNVAEIQAAIDPILIEYGAAE